MSVGEAGNTAAPGPLDILIVDDNSMLTSSIRELFEYSGCVCAVAHNGEAALEILRGLDQPPRAILCDLVMPVMDGFELLQALRTDPRWRETFVVVASGRDEDRSPALALGADVFLSKPFPIHKLIELVLGRRDQA